MGKTIAFANHKGGVGKTTTAISLGAALAEMGKRVLLLDMDAQANLTISIGLDTDEEKDIHYYLYNNKALEPVEVRKNLYAVPSGLSLIGLDSEMDGSPNKWAQLSFCLDTIRGKYDYIFIDCGPSFGVATVNALVAADELYIPLSADGLAVKGLKTFTDMVDLTKKNISKRLEIGGVIITRYDSRKTLHREVANMIRERFGSKVFGTMIRENVSIAEAPLSGKNILEYAPKSKGAEDYRMLAREVIKRK